MYKRKRYLFDINTAMEVFIFCFVIAIVIECIKVNDVFKKLIILDAVAIAFLFSGLFIFVIALLLGAINYFRIRINSVNKFLEYPFCEIEKTYRVWKHNNKNYARQIAVINYYYQEGGEVDKIIDTYNFGLLYKRRTYLTYNIEYFNDLIGVFSGFLISILAALAYSFITSDILGEKGDALILRFVVPFLLIIGLLAIILLRYADGKNGGLYRTSIYKYEKSLLDDKIEKMYSTIDYSDKVVQGYRDDYKELSSLLDEYSKSVGNKRKKRVEKEIELFYYEKDLNDPYVKFYFFIGTEAELIKMFPVIMTMEKRGIPYRIIASGQNNITKSRVLTYTNGGRVDIELSREEDIIKTGFGLFRWYINTRRNAKRMLLQKYPELENAKNDVVMIVHGDTISTVMGAYLGRRLGFKIAHIEAGLRSHHLFNPFPEEIDRILTDAVSDYLFVPGEQGIRNLKRKKNVCICDTSYNTLIDSFETSQNVECNDEAINSILKEDYFIFVLHRQENINNDDLIKKLMDRVREAANERRCIVILHKITEVKFKKMGYLKKLENDDRFELLPRTDYFDFMKLLAHARYVITDGGSDQGELSYMGVPTLIIRQSTEQVEGIGENVIIYGGDDTKMDYFFDNYSNLRRENKQAVYSVSDYIVYALTNEVDMAVNEYYSLGEKKNSKRYKACVYDTSMNTIRDSLAYAQKIALGNPDINSFIDSDYFVFAMHRQENINNEALIRLMVSRLYEASEHIKCVVVLYEITKLKLMEMQILDSLRSDERFILLDRTDYFDYIKILKSARFVVTDGGSNQEELSYMRIPTLIIRKATERTEGLNDKVVLYEGIEGNILEFFRKQLEV